MADPDMIRVSKRQHFHEWNDDRCVTCGAVAMMTTAQMDAWRAKAAAGFPPPSAEEVAARALADEAERLQRDVEWEAHRRLAPLMFPTGPLWDKCIPEPNTGCWLWTASVRTSGYGCLRIDGRLVSAHRAAWETVHGPIPPHPDYHGLCVCHTCDTPLCINPAHLFLGTMRENMEDASRKGRLHRV